MIHGIELDDYEVVNLRALLEAIGDHRTALSALDTGDWRGQILAKLPEVDLRPNETPRGMAFRVATRIANRLMDIG